MQKELFGFRGLGPGILLQMQGLDEIFKEVKRGTGRVFLVLVEVTKYWLNSGALLADIPDVFKNFDLLVDHIANCGGSRFVLVILPDWGTGFVKGRQLERACAFVNRRVSES